MAKPWYKRFCRYLAKYSEETPALIVVTPVVHTEPPPKPLTIVAPVGKVTAGVKRKAKRKRP